MRLLPALGLCLLISAAVCRAAPPVVTVRVDRSRVVTVSRFETGVTHAQHSLDPEGDPAAIARGKALLEAACRYQNQHSMGWGADNPEPSPGDYHWQSLDRRIGLLRSLHAVSVITLCAAPDWMKGGQSGRTDWSKIEVAPLPEHYADFAALAAQVARRYPDVLHFQVWNEMKGLWDPKTNNWNYVGYTDLYNKVYDALKAVNPHIQVGGPYLVIEGTGTDRGDWATETPVRARQWEILNYWLAHKHGADFITIDRGLQDFHDHAVYTPAQKMALTPVFESIARQIRAKTPLPLWWAEYYAGMGDPGFVAACNASVMAHMALGGTSVALLWSPQESDVPHALFSDTSRPGGGRPYPHYSVFKAFHDDFGPGTRLYRTVSSAPDVEALASGRHVMLINKRAASVTVRLNGRNVFLRRYEVRVLATRL